jgi:hypothetical protein
MIVIIVGLRGGNVATVAQHWLILFIIVFGGWKKKLVLGRHVAFFFFPFSLDSNSDEQRTCGFYLLACVMKPGGETRVFCKYHAWVFADHISQHCHVFLLREFGKIAS